MFAIRQMPKCIYPFEGRGTTDETPVMGVGGTAPSLVKQNDYFLHVNDICRVGMWEHHSLGGMPQCQL